MLEEGQYNRAAKPSLVARLINLCGLPSKCNITAFGASSDTIFGGLSMLIKYVSLHVVNMPLVSLLFLIRGEP